MAAKTYLGDGVYAWIDDAGQVVLITEDGTRRTNTIYLEPAVLDALLTYLRSQGVIR